MKKDFAALQGAWQIASLEVDGEVMPTGAFTNATVVVDGDHFTSLGMGGEYEGTIELDSSKKPKAFDLVITSGHAAGSRNRGIYRIDDGEWTLCLATRGDKRPRSFATKPDSGLALETFTRTGAAHAAEPTRTPARAGKPAAKAAEPESAGPPTALEGVWQMVGAVMNGVPMPPNMMEWCRRETRGDVTTVLAGTNVMLRARFSLDEAQSPWSIDYVNLAGSNAGKPQAGIAELAGGLLQICIAPPGGARPAEFASVKGDKRSYTTWIRITAPG
jgi:uncharacterized protein (TIGR03067 family)